MKSTRYILTNILLLACFIKANACWEPSYTPGEYYVFYAYPKEQEETDNSQEEQNIEEWGNYASGKATLKDINQVVYEYSISDMESLLSALDTKKLTDDENTFVQYLFSTRDRDALSLLLLAKKCYQAREKRWDPWWYPTKDDLKHFDLKLLLDEALAYKGKKMAIRYNLQAIRAAVTMGNDDLCMELWNQKIKNSPNSVVKQMCESHVAGILFRRKQYHEAAKHFISSGDESSFWWCANYLIDKNTDIDLIKIMYQYAPNAPVLPVMLQQIVREAEIGINPKFFNNDTSEWYEKEQYAEFIKKRKHYMSLRDLSLKIASEGRTNNPAVWQYAAAFLTMLDGKVDRANEMLQTASKMKSTPFIKDNIKILQLMIDAKLGSYDEAFENQIFPQLKWLDNKIVNNITKEVKETTSNDTYMMKDNFSYYYYNDMMRKIALSIIAPNYLQRKNPVKAAAFAGMATECLPKLVGTRRDDWRSDSRMLSLTEYRKDTTTRNQEYSNDLFWMLDTMKTSNVVAYKNYLFSKKKSEFDKFLTERCYASRNYLNELIGTKYIRLMQFDKAAYYLSNVDEYYEKTLNIYQDGYLSNDPFYPSWLIPDRKTATNTDRQKLNYCRRMSELKKLIQTTRNTEKKAQYAYEYAVGLSQIISINWALAAYGRGEYYNHVMENSFETYSDKFLKETEKYLTLSQQLTHDKNLQAQCIFAKVKITWNVDEAYVYRNGSWEYSPSGNLKKYYDSIKNSYTQTAFYNETITKCDSFKDYIASSGVFSQ